jgi:hypothetical protein
MVPLVANNPAFKVEILPVDGRLEQKPFAKDGSKQIESIKVGDAVRGDVVNSSKNVKGKVLQINQQNGEIVSYKVLSKDGEEVLIDPTTAVKFLDHGQESDSTESPEVHKNQPGLYGESYQIKTYESWLSESASRV